MREALEDFPGMAFSFSQPIACRIDELVAGTRAQVIIKLFGEDLEVLRGKAEAIAAVLGRVRGSDRHQCREHRRTAVHLRSGRTGP